MNADTPSPRAGDPFPWLAGRADGELDPATRRAVDEWMAGDPAVAELFRDQQRFAPTNGAYWIAVEPPSPDAGCWANVREAVGHAVHPPSRLADSHGRRMPSSNRLRSRRSKLRHAVVVTGVAAAVAIGVILAVARVGDIGGGPDRPAGRDVAGPSSDGRPETIPIETIPIEPVDPLADVAILPMAERTDVFVESVSGDSEGELIGFNSPFPDRIDLAGTEDVELEAVSTNENGRECRLDLSTTSPMIYAARP